MICLMLLFPDLILLILSLFLVQIRRSGVMSLQLHATLIFERHAGPPPPLGSNQ